ncbi:MAG: N-acetyltransferase [Firmicutes bacterium]|nr:N-acetyltransferase [Bacillota bacterium]
MLRQATLGDVEAIACLLTGYAEQGLLLPRSRQSICETLLAFRVIEEAGNVVGTAALHILGDDLAEIRSLAVVETAQGKGYGQQLVKELCTLAKQLDVPRVLALTYQQNFFDRCGFRVVDKSSLHQKIWKDCIHCRKFPVCDEIAMVWTAIDVTQEHRKGVRMSR